MKLWLFLILLIPVSAQDMVSSIMEHNPFDPNRGKKDEGVVEEVEDELPADLPLCDGTLILGESRYVLLTFTIEGKPDTETLMLNESSHGYSVAEIEYDQVVLNQAGRSHTIKLFFQEEKAEHRGGTRKGATMKIGNNDDKGAPAKPIVNRGIREPTRSKTPPKIIKRRPTTTNNPNKKIDF